MANFINFEELVGGIRVRLAHETEGILRNVEPIICSDEDSLVYITTVDGVKKIAEISYSDNSVKLLSMGSAEYDFMDLETDDMVAIYEYVYYVLFEKDK